mgnify:CR=1 FL=1
MKIATYNINSIKAHAVSFFSWLKRNNPDIVLLQEIKCDTENFLYFELSINKQKIFLGFTDKSNLVYHILFFISQKKIKSAKPPPRAPRKSTPLTL